MNVDAAKSFSPFHFTFATRKYFASGHLSASIEILDRLNNCWHDQCDQTCCEKIAQFCQKIAQFCEKSAQFCQKIAQNGALAWRDPSSRLKLVVQIKGEKILHICISYLWVCLQKLFHIILIMYITTFARRNYWSKFWSLKTKST
jgi:hypothetical protein